MSPKHGLPSLLRSLVVSKAVEVAEARPQASEASGVEEEGGEPRMLAAMPPPLLPDTSPLMTTAEVERQEKAAGVGLEGKATEARWAVAAETGVSWGELGGGMPTAGTRGSWWGRSAPPAEPSLPH